MLYTIRFRGYDTGGRAALIVEDADGVGYLFSGGYLQLALPVPDAAARLAGLLSRVIGWLAVPAVDPYRADELAWLLGQRAARGAA